MYQVKRGELQESGIKGRAEETECVTTRNPRKAVPWKQEKKNMSNTV